MTRIPTLAPRFRRTALSSALLALLSLASPWPGGRAFAAPVDPAAIPSPEAAVRIPRETGHAFHPKLDGDSTGNWTPIPWETGHLR
jgi:hypothetical protein